MMERKALGHKIIVSKNVSIQLGTFYKGLKDNWKSWCTSHFEGACLMGTYLGKIQHDFISWRELCKKQMVWENELFI